MGHSKGLKGVVIVVAVVMLVAFSTPSTWAQQDLSKLMKRIEKLEAENKSLKASLGAVESKVSGIKSGAAALVPAGDVFAKDVKVQIYGKIAVDTIYADSADGDFVFNAPRETRGTIDDDKEFNIGARDTRIGLKITAPGPTDDSKVIGKIETDFYGASTTSGTSGNSLLRLRQAYVQLAFPTWDILAGQTWDFFSPLNPSTLNFGVMWRSGNIGDRHKQIILTKKLEDVMGGNVALKIGAVDSDVDSQEKRGLPVAAAYASYENKDLAIPVYLGVGAIAGQYQSTATSKHLDIQGAMFSYKLGLTDKLSLLGEGFYGQNLAPYRGGTATGTSTANKAVRSVGGWSQLSYQATDKFQINTGAGIDSLVSDLGDDATAATVTGTWDYNWNYFTNIKYKLTKNLTWGLEFQHFSTRYNDAVSSETNRIQSSLILAF